MEKQINQETLTQQNAVQEEYPKEIKIGECIFNVEKKFSRKKQKSYFAVLSEKSIIGFVHHNKYGKGFYIKLGPLLIGKDHFVENKFKCFGNEYKYRDAISSKGNKYKEVLNLDNRKVGVLFNNNSFGGYDLYMEFSI